MNTFPANKFFSEKTLLHQFPSYVLIGCLILILNISILYLLTKYLEIFYILSAIISGIISTLTSFILNKKITFKDKKRKNTLKFLKFTGFRIFGGFFSLSFLYLLTSIIGVYYLFSQIIAICSTGILTFSCNKIFTFK